MEKSNQSSSFHLSIFVMPSIIIFSAMYKMSKWKLAPMLFTHSMCHNNTFDNNHYWIKYRDYFIRIIIMYLCKYLGRYLRDKGHIVHIVRKNKYNFFSYFVLFFPQQKFQHTFRGLSLKLTVSWCYHRNRKIAKRILLKMLFIKTPPPDDKFTNVC